MNKETKKAMESYQNTFNQTADREVEKQFIKCNIDEFNELLLNKEYLIVVIKRNEKSEFLFREKPNYLTENAKYIILNFKYGLSEANLTEKLDKYERNLNRLEII